MLRCVNSQSEGTRTVSLTLAPIQPTFVSPSPGTALDGEGINNSILDHIIIKCFHGRLTVVESPAFINVQNMKDVKDSIVRNTVHHVISSR